MPLENVLGLDQRSSQGLLVEMPLAIVKHVIAIKHAVVPLREKLYDT
jgi:hypothetical protein